MSHPQTLGAPPTTPTEFVTFAQYELPGLPAGVYELDVRVRVDDSTGSTLSDPLANSYRFAVNADRFALRNPSIIASVFPADNASGALDTVFAHVVINSPRFPWVRFPTLTQPDPSASTTGVPTWLAVLVLDADDAVDPSNPTGPALFDLTPKIATVEDLFPQTIYPASTLGATTYSYFSPQAGAGPTATTAPLGSGESLTDPIQVIDLPLSLFAAIAPTCDDLALNAHVRQVALAAKASTSGTAPATATMPAPTTPTDSGEEAVGTYAIVVGNRLPQEQKQSHAYLVSLEGMAPFLPTDPEGGTIPGVTMTWSIRLAVLQHWTFFSHGSSAAFDDALLALNAPVDGRPSVTNLRLDVPGATEPLASVFAAGYVPLDHSLRSKGGTVSWYRGPLSPVARTGPVPNLPISSPDAALAFDPTTGMFDASLAAAWTLGRLLALHDTAFATALYGWKQGLARAVVVDAERAFIAEEFGGALSSIAPVPDGDTRHLLHHAMSLLSRTERAS